MHRRNDATLYWHLEKSFLTRTHEYHHIAIDIGPGKHTVTLVDEHGLQLQLSFIALGEGQ